MHTECIVVFSVAGSSTVHTERIVVLVAGSSTVHTERIVVFSVAGNSTMHTECIVVFSRQQCLRERVLVLRYTYIVYLVKLTLRLVYPFRVVRGVFFTSGQCDRKSGAPDSFFF